MESVLGFGLDSPLSTIAPSSDSHSGSTPDSLDIPNLSWPYDSIDPNALHDFIFDAPDTDDDPFAFSFDDDGSQGAVGVVAPLDHYYPTATADDYPTVDTASTATGEGEEAPYAPIVRSVKATKRVVCQSACVQCRRAKTRCDGQRPCARCATHGRAAECMDRPAEEIERGKQNRRRKPKAINKTQQQLPPNITDDTSPPLPPNRPTIDPLPPSPFDSQAQSLTSPAARLAFGQSAVLRQSIVDRVNRMCATRAADDPARIRFLRAVHLLLVKKADCCSAKEFDMFITNRLPGTDPTAHVEPLPACLRMWERLETRPLYLDWTTSPTVCDADETPDAPPTMRIRTGPAAHRAFAQWEGRAEALSEHQQPPPPAVAPAGAGQAQNGAVQPIEELFSCLSISDTVGPAAPQAKAPSSRHAPWCPVQSGIVPAPHSTASADDTPSSHPPVPPPCVCFAATALPTSFSVNAAWERFYGYTQSELRLSALRRGTAIMTDWYATESWWALHSLLASHALIDRQTGYRFRAFVVIRTRWGAEVPCLLEKVVLEGGDGSSQAVQTTTPLAQLTQRQQQQQDDGSPFD